MFNVLLLLHFSYSTPLKLSNQTFIIDILSSYIMGRIKLTSLQAGTGRN